MGAIDAMNAAANAAAEDHAGTSPAALEQIRVEISAQLDKLREELADVERTTRKGTTLARDVVDASRRATTAAARVERARESADVRLLLAAVVLALVVAIPAAVVAAVAVEVWPVSEALDYYHAGRQVEQRLQAMDPDDRKHVIEHLTKAEEKP